MGIDLGRGRIDLKCEQAKQRPWHYQATVSSKNLEVRTITAASSGVYFGIDESPGGKQVYRTQEDGFFQPLGIYATAVAAVSEQEVLFGGPPSSGAAYSVIQRSSDGGLTAAVVSSLSPFVSKVHEIFQVGSATYLASTSSGGIWRSTDAGKNWNLTMTISPAYHVRRFYRPSENCVWAATGYDSPAAANGAYIWQSEDGGISWSLKHTVIASGDFAVQGIFGVDADTFLISTTGASVNELGVYRSRYDSANSYSWIRVLDQIGFSELVHTDSGHLLFGFQQEFTLSGGTSYRSLDQGSSWFEDSRIAKRGNVRLMQNDDGTVEAFTARILAGSRTDRHRNFEPDRIN